jgi:hypothetical protein
MAPKARMDGRFGMPMPDATQAGRQRRDDPEPCNAMACDARARLPRQGACEVAWFIGARVAG